MESKPSRLPTDGIVQWHLSAINAGDVDAESIRRRYILQSSFTGGPRYMMHHYQDAIANFRAMSPPDFLVSFTYNPNWPEITNALLPGQRS